LVGWGTALIVQPGLGSAADARAAPVAIIVIATIVIMISGAITLLRRSAALMRGAVCIT
jgi:hypothetical protein